jgi:hypothetical protein
MKTLCSILAFCAAGYVLHLHGYSAAQLAMAAVVAAIWAAIILIVVEIYGKGNADHE